MERFSVVYVVVPGSDNDIARAGYDRVEMIQTSDDDEFELVVWKSESPDVRMLWDVETKQASTPYKD
jgi:hypothetical protein